MILYHNMGLLKYFFNKFRCKSNCQFNLEDLPKDILDINLKSFKLTDKDLKYIWNIANKRPSLLSKDIPKDMPQITEI